MFVFIIVSDYLKISPITASRINKLNRSTNVDSSFSHQLLLLLSTSQICQSTYSKFSSIIISRTLIINKPIFHKAIYAIQTDSIPTHSQFFFPVNKHMITMWKKFNLTVSSRVHPKNNDVHDFQGSFKAPNGLELVDIFKILCWYAFILSQHSAVISLSYFKFF